MPQTKTPYRHSLTTENVIGQPPPIQATHDFLRFFTERNYNVLCDTLRLFLLQIKPYIRHKYTILRTLRFSINLEENKTAQSQNYWSDLPF